MNTGYNFNLNCISTTGATIEKVYFYDTYSFLSGSHRSDFKDLTPPSTGEANGLLAGSIVIASNGEYIYTVNCYDPKGNLTSCFVKSINGYTAKTTNTYSLTNKLKNTTTEVDIKYGVPFMVTEVNEYSNKNDMINNKTIMLSHGAGDCVTNIKYKYDSFNRIQNIIRPGKAGVVQYSYDDIHGWPVLIKSNSFTEQISFTGKIRARHTREKGFGAPLYEASAAYATDAHNKASVALTIPKGIPARELNLRSTTEIGTDFLQLSLAVTFRRTAETALHPRRAAIKARITF